MKLAIKSVLFCLACIGLCFAYLFIGCTWGFLALSSFHIVCGLIGVSLFVFLDRKESKFQKLVIDFLNGETMVILSVVGCISFCLFFGGISLLSVLYIPVKEYLDKKKPSIPPGMQQTASG